MGDGEELELITEEAITRALELARARALSAEVERGKLERVIERARHEERLLDRLLALRRNGDLASPDQADAVGEDGTRDHDARVEGKHPAVQAVVEELAAAGRPLHISEMMRLLRDRKVRIPGSGTQANLITHLRRDERLVRPSRGMYGLSTWGLESMPATRRMRRKKKRMRSTASEQGRSQG